MSGGGRRPALATNTKASTPRSCPFESINGMHTSRSMSNRISSVSIGKRSIWLRSWNSIGWPRRSTPNR